MAQILFIELVLQTVVQSKVYKGFNFYNSENQFSIGHYLVKIVLGTLYYGKLFKRTASTRWFNKCKKHHGVAEETIYFLIQANCNSWNKLCSEKCSGTIRFI